MQTTAGALSTASPVESSAESVLHALMTISRLMRQRMAHDGVDPGTFWLLKGLAANDALRVTELAALANLDASTVSRHVAQLHRTGLIERSQDPADGRAQRVAISAAGRDLLHDGLSRRRELLINSLNGWNTEDVETLDRLLSRLMDDIDNSELEQA
jgi:DNA-binding MarR family transcriptional regulator